LDAATIERLVVDYQAGLSGDQLAVQYRVARSSVLKLLHEHGIALRYPRLTPDERTQIAALYVAGVSQVDIAKQFGRDPSLIWHTLRRAGLKGGG
jgi:hypothetical protein